MPTPTNDEIAASLTLASGTIAHPERVAAEVAATWRDIDEALTPIIGKRGVAALYGRSVHLARQAHPWLASAEAGAPATMDLGVLVSMLSAQTAAEAAAGGGRLLHAFHELLTNLIGASLTERLLRSVWARFLVNAPLDGLS
jgi:hypothetical protein